MSDSPADVAPPAAAPVPRARGDRAVITAGPMVHGAVCLARLDDGTALLVDGALPGERVEVELHHRKGRVWFARVVEVLVPSAHRVAAPCPYYGVCGGCQLQHVDYPEQLALKEAIVRDAMGRAHVELPATVRVVGMDDPWRYRWRGEFHVIPGEDGMASATLGFNRMRSWTPVAVDDCLIHHPRITSSLGALRGLVRDAGRDTLTALHLTAGEDGDELLLRPARRRRYRPARSMLTRARRSSGGAPRPRRCAGAATPSASHPTPSCR